MQTEKLKIVLASESAYALIALIEQIIQAGPDDEMDKLIMANLAEVLFSLKQKTLVPDKQYKMKLSAAQALALRIMYMQTHINGEHFKNELLRISNQVHQKYFTA